MDISSIVASGMQAMRSKVDAHAHNLAKVRTPGYKRLDAHTTERSEGGVDLLVERDPRSGNVQYASGDRPQPSSADDPASAGPSSLERAESSAELTPAPGSDVDAYSASQVNKHQLMEGSNLNPNVDPNVDLVEEIVGMNQSVQSMAMLAAVYQRADQAMGTMFDAFG